MKRFLLVIALAAFTGAANTSPGCAAGAPVVGPDGGTGGDVDAGQACDAGGSCDPNSAVADACVTLVQNCCGATCGHSAGCEAATLLQQFEPDQCEAALGNTQQFPVCEAGNCDTLVSKVCGADDRCDSAPGCAPAKQLQSRANDPTSTQQQVADANASCLQALEDETVFAPCP
jgi:hypothetical protein